MIRGSMVDISIADLAFIAYLSAVFAVGIVVAVIGLLRRS